MMLVSFCSVLWHTKHEWQPNIGRKRTAEGSGALLVVAVAVPLVAVPLGYPLRGRVLCMGICSAGGIL